METVADVLTDACPLRDAAQANLGDARRTKRWVEVLSRFLEDPSASVPEAMREPCEMTGYYRLMSHEAVEHAELLESHLESTAQRAEQLTRTLVVHDTTEFSFDIHDQPAREHLARLSTHRQGFLWHASLSVAADGSRAPLGLVASRPFVHREELEQDSSLEMWQQLDGIFDNEQRRWLEAVESSEERLAEVEHVIHLMDREADDYQTLFAMEMSGYSYVVRMAHDRNVSQGPRRKDYGKLSQALEQVDWHDESREILLSARPARKATSGHPVRRARKASVKVRATKVELRRPDRVRATHAPATQAVHVVEVLEVDPPRGEEPIRWVLVTDQPIETVEQCWQIVDWYRCRWVIDICQPQDPCRLPRLLKTQRLSDAWTRHARRARPSVSESLCRPRPHPSRRFRAPDVTGSSRR